MPYLFIYMPKYLCLLRIKNIYRLHCAFDFLEREMMNDEFGFYSSYDADSEGVEGKYYTFTFDEIKTLFGEDITFVSRLYNIEKPAIGNTQIFYIAPLIMMH